MLPPPAPGVVGVCVRPLSPGAVLRVAKVPAVGAPGQLLAGVAALLHTQEETAKVIAKVQLAQPSTTPCTCRVLVLEVLVLSRRALWSAPPHGLLPLPLPLPLPRPPPHLLDHLLVHLPPVAPVLGPGTDFLEPEVKLRLLHDSLGTQKALSFVQPDIFHRRSRICRCRSSPACCPGSPASRASRCLQFCERVKGGIFLWWQKFAN